MFVSGLHGSSSWCCIAVIQVHVQMLGNNSSLAIL